MPQTPQACGRGAGRIRFLNLLISSSHLLPAETFQLPACVPTHRSGEFPGKLRGVGSAIQGGPGKRKTTRNVHVDARGCHQCFSSSPKQLLPRDITRIYSKGQGEMVLNQNRVNKGEFFAVRVVEHWHGLPRERWKMP